MNIPPAVVAALHASAPTLLRGLLPPPLGLIAAAAVTPLLSAFLPPGEAPAARTGDGRAVLSNDQIMRVVAERADDPAFRDTLQTAEVELRKVEAQLPFRFEELAQRDRSDARKLAVDSGLAPLIFEVGKTVLWNDRILAYIMVGGGLLLLVISGFFRIQIDPILSNAIFTIVGVVIGRQSSRADQVASWLFGSSNTSQNKDRTIQDAVAQLGGVLGRGVGPLRLPPPVMEPAAPPAPLAPSPGPAAPVVASPGAAGMSPEQFAELIRPHNRFPGSVMWALTRDGISTDGGTAHRTVGEPETIRHIWRDYGPLIVGAAQKWGVPVEVIAAVCAVESGGNPLAHRTEPDGRMSRGLMQTLTDTASDMRGAPVQVDELNEPALSLDLGTAYIAFQRKKTGLDPILVAAAYNAGGIRHASSPRNPWRLVCYPAETGKHCTDFSRWFGDAMRESRSARWTEDGKTPSFAVAFAASAVS